MRREETIRRLGINAGLSQDTIERALKRQSRLPDNYYEPQSSAGLCVYASNKARMDAWRETQKKTRAEMGVK